MKRPLFKKNMASLTTRIKSIRIANETADYFEDKPLNRIVESVHELMESGKARFDGNSLVVSDLSEMGLNDPVLSDIEEMVKLCGMTLGDFLKDVDEGLNEGRLLIDKGRLVLPELNTDAFVTACRGRDPQKVLDEITERLC